MSTTKQFDKSKIIDDRDLEYIKAKTDPILQDAMYCSITTYRRPDQLEIGDPMPPLDLVALGSSEGKNLATKDGRPTVLIFGSYT
jgi:hypothetical protein